MAVAKSTIIIAAGHSSNAQDVKWSSFDSGDNNIHFDMNTVDASKMLILVACHSTLTHRWYIGTSASAASHTSMQYPYSAAGIGRWLIRTTAKNDADPISIFKSTDGGSSPGTLEDTEVMGIYTIGPFETARFKDSDGYINMCRAKTTVGAVSDSDAHYIAAILIP